MSLQAKIEVLYHQVAVYLGRLVGYEPPQLTVPLIPDLTRYFLSEAIEDRVRFLAGGVAGQEETLRDEVTREYCARVEQSLRQHLREQSLRFKQLEWHRFTKLEKRLREIKLPTQFSDDVFATRGSLIRFMRKRMALVPGRLRSHEGLAVAGAFLCAIQQVSLDIIRVDYPATGTGPGVEVPLAIQDVVRRVLLRVEELQRRLQTPVELLRTLAKAETELRVLVARTKGVACLPLRPIPTSPLSNEEDKHYVGRPDEHAQRLARQIRHADGTILVTGYRGVGKSSFVNRVIFHALKAQREVPSDGWLIVPVTVNLAKVAGVQNILRITLRSVREALLEVNTRKARTTPGHLDSIRLPLSSESEIEPLEEAYIRATYKVTMSRSAGSEKRWDLGSSISIDPGQLLGGKLVGLELGKFLEAGIRNTKTQKINRELSLLDFDENAAEENLARLIRNLATPRSLFPGGPAVRIKLVFIFDELDKMDIDTGLKPMIEGLKNLFLQQHSVFILVTSKRLYYDLLKDRAIEDAMLNSYFSAIVHVPLLSFAEARKMVEDWVDWNATEQLKTPAPAESKLIDQLTRVLVYRSFGNPRDIIRELRLMQDWADTADQPYLTDRLSRSPNLQIFAAIQDCIEKTAVPQQTSGSIGIDGDGAVALVSERLVGDEARLEQVRRGLYILTEELINRQRLIIDPPSVSSSEESEKMSALEKIQQDNFSLLSLDDVRQLAKRLAGYLNLMHDNPDLFITPDWGPRVPLFQTVGPELRVTNVFYALTGRQAVVAPETFAFPAQTKTPQVLIDEAENFLNQESWAAKLAAMNIIKQLGSDKLTPELKKFLWKIVETDEDPNHRFAAAERLPQRIDSQDETEAITKRVSKETDERVVSILIGLLSGVTGDEARKIATDAIVDLLRLDTAGKPLHKLSDSTAIIALTVLQTVASYDVTSYLLAWLRVAGTTELVQTTAISVLKKNSEDFNVDIANRIISDYRVFEYFRLGGKPPVVRPNSVPLAYLRELLRKDPLAYAPMLLRTTNSLIPKADGTFSLDELLIYVWDLSFDSYSQQAATYVLQEVLDTGDTKADVTWQFQLTESLRNTPGFQERILPYLRRQLEEQLEKKRFTSDQAKLIEQTLKSLEAMPEPSSPVKSKLRPEDFFKLPHHGTVSPPFFPTSASEWNPRRTIACLAGAILLFLPGFFLYKADLPAQASFQTVLGSRLLLLILDGLIIYPFVTALKRTMETINRIPREKTSPVPDLFYGLVFPLAYAVYYTHTKYIGPLHFWPQVQQFIINWPAIIAILFAFRLYKP